MWIMVLGSYASGAPDAAAQAANLRAECGGTCMMPVSLAVAERCDACLRIGGASRGADDEVERFRSAGRAVYFSVDDIPMVSTKPGRSGSC
jgi:hypothetical protein